jgi:chromosome partitioning protein
MIITVVSYKGGVAKSTTAAHIAAYLQQERGSTVLIDGDKNRSLMKWAKRGSFPYPVVDERETAKVSREYENIVIDTRADPEPEDFEYLAKGCDLLIVPTTPDRLALDALVEIVQTLKGVAPNRYRILLTRVPPKPNRSGEVARDVLKEHGLPVLEQMISNLMAFQKAADEGVIVHEVKDPNAPRGWEEYRKAIEEALQ